MTKIGERLRVYVRYYYERPLLIGPMVHTKTYISTYFYSQYLVLFTVVPVLRSRTPVIISMQLYLLIVLRVIAV